MTRPGLTGPTPPAVQRLARSLGVDAPLRSLKRMLGPLQDGLELQLAFTITRFPVRKLRHAVYRAMGMRIGPSSLVHRGVEVRKAHRISIGEDSVIGFDTILDGREGITIGDHVNISSQAAIWTLQHDHRDPTFYPVGGPVVIEDRVWLSFRATVLPGVTIGEGAIVAAGAIVTKDVAPYTIVAGMPARAIGERSPKELDYRVNLGAPPWFV